MGDGGAVGKTWAWWIKAASPFEVHFTRAVGGLHPSPGNRARHPQNPLNPLKTRHPTRCGAFERGVPGALSHGTPPPLLPRAPKAPPPFASRRRSPTPSLNLGPNNHASNELAASLRSFVLDHRCARPSAYHSNLRPLPLPVHYIKQLVSSGMNTPSLDPSSSRPLSPPRVDDTTPLFHNCMSVCLRTACIAPATASLSRDFFCLRVILAKLLLIPSFPGVVP
jgi:hypothetical protein